MKFVADSMLGGLCRLLRMLGFDCAFHLGSTEELLINAKSENRLILSRNSRLKGRAGVLYIRSNNIREQLKEIDCQCHIKGSIRPLTRCLICNQEIQPVSKDDIAGKVPYYTFIHFEEYYRCPICQRIYWNGSHRKGMEKKIERIIDVLD